MQTSTWVGAIVIVIIIVGGAWWFMSQPTSPTPETATQSNTSATTGGTSDNSGSPSGNVSTNVSGSVTTGAPMSATVTYSASGFSPATITIAKGGTVTFVDQAGTPMWVASDEHPSHTEFDGTSRTTHCATGYTGTKPFDQCGAGQSYSFMFSKVGTFDYHNHSAAQYTGKVVVQ